ncbi:MAG: ketosynthase [Xanthomonadaceae bacterium]|nr:ketosynthase [Xanthomonadaceae bacterium]
MPDRPASPPVAGIFACAYPIVAHLAIASGSTRWTIAAIALLAGAALTPALVRGRVVAWLCVPVLAAACWVLVRVATPVMLLYVAPVLVPAFLAWFFGQTLVGGRTPLIARLIELVHRDREPPEPAVWPYARRLTRAWTIFFIALALANLTLAALANPHGLLLAAGLHPWITVPQYWWSLFANIIAYLAVAAFFAIEYAYRRRRFPQQPFRSLYDFLRQVGAVMPRLLRTRDET